ncbi:MAG: NAD(P)H-hydrate dehydratase [Terrimicrobiaceae bacterium]|nr:NAD(P)H-hydrate dehydratase [Terrimicrobiaceae bacterium]
MEARILSPSAMREAEQTAFARGISAADLMEAAGWGIARAVLDAHPNPGVCSCFYGKGNNGGDVLVAARHLAARGWHLRLHPAFPEPALDPLPASRLRLLRQQPGPASPQGPGLVVLDGLLGTGAHGPPREPVAAAIREINHLRDKQGAWVAAADVPSGLDAETGHPSEPCVTADATITIACAKSGLLADAATPFVGRLVWVPLPDLDMEIAERASDSWHLAVPESLRLPPLPYDRHKGDAGRVAVAAGSPGFTGAARLCAAGALRGGAGLITLFAHPSIARAMEAACPPEIMVREAARLREILDFPSDVLAIGPGLGRERDADALALIRDFPGPAVVDADALNALAGDSALLRRAKGPRILTPHPGEMERLRPRAGCCRRDWAAGFAAEHGVVVLLKGSRTAIAGPDGRGYFNTTGGPGMATGGMGDVLTGVVAALLAAGIEPLEAAATGAWACGRAADMAVRGSAPEALTASDVLSSLGAAFAELRRAGFQ